MCGAGCGWGVVCQCIEVTVVIYISATNKDILPATLWYVLQCVAVCCSVLQYVAVIYISATNKDILPATLWYVCIHAHEYLQISIQHVYCYRVAKMHRMPYLYRSFSTIKPYN